jgi:hypothetical protein
MFWRELKIECSFIEEWWVSVNAIVWLLGVSIQPEPIKIQNQGKKFEKERSEIAIEEPKITSQYESTTDSQLQK